MSRGKMGTRWCAVKAMKEMPPALAEDKRRLMTRIQLSTIWCLALICGIARKRSVIQGSVSNEHYHPPERSHFGTCI